MLMEKLELELEIGNGMETNNAPIIDAMFTSWTHE